MAGVEPRILGTSSDPADQTEHNYTVPGNGPLKILAVILGILTDVTAPTRVIELTFETSAGVIFYRTVIDTAIAASQQQELVAASGILDATIGLNSYMKLPDNFIVPTGTVIKTITSNFAGTDNYDPLSVFGYSDGRWSV